ncbi:hypothetical protein [Corticicoccus populi]|uniref:Uncharacterized protein n=1 Tax=Corticicoccus populi TaxID=1812821 RepID=A0ABW5WSN3_9STAP
MLDIKLSTIEESGEELVVKQHTYENDEDAKELYDKLTEEYAEQSLPFFGKGEQLLKLEILETDSEDFITECYFEYTEELKGHLYQRL